MAGREVVSFPPYFHEDKSLTQLLRGNLVFQACRFQPLVNHAQRLLKWMDDLITQRPVDFLVKSTFFGHFCGGETEAQVEKTRKELGRHGILTILDYAAEADVEALDSPRDLGVDRLLLTSRTFEYEGEAECDANMRLCIDAVKAAGEGGIAAIKLTALGQPDTLAHVSHVLLESRESFKTMADNQDSFTKERFLDFTTEEVMGLSEADRSELFDEIDRNNDGEVDLLEWISYVAPLRLSRQEVKDKAATNCLTPNSKTRLSTEQISRFGNLLRRATSIAEAAANHGATVLVDAEQTYLQPAIDHITLHLQREFNRDRAVVYNTYQCYLVDAYPRLCFDVERSRRESFKFGAKLVRGAYLVQERARAVELGYDDPIHATKEDTDGAFDMAVKFVFENLGQASMIIASHNSDSVRYALTEMKDRGLEPDNPHVAFASLYGMCDHVAFPLGAAGYNTFKYLPYGPVREVIPYLIRRAQENSAMLGNAATERSLLLTALKKRLFGSA